MLEKCKMTYIKRISDIELQRKLNSSGAVLIRGAKACGKTESAKQLAASILNVDRDEQVPAFMETSPQRLLHGKTPRLIESLATHELRVYAQANDAKVYYYRDSSNLEVDAIVQKYNGDWMAFEIKLGTGQIDEAAANLHKLVSVLDDKRTSPPKSLNIITGTGVSYTRVDGINVISLASLGV